MVEQAKQETKEIVPRKMPAIPIGASCYFCLEEGLDDMGEPLLRDCSCRGDGVGFAHLSCMIKYAEQKSKEAAGKDPKSFSKPWYECPNCKQCFKNELSLDMSSAFISFVESIYCHPGNSFHEKVLVMTALRHKIVTIVGLMTQYLRKNDNTVTSVDMLVKVHEGKILSKNVLAMVEKVKKEEMMNSFLYKALRADYEARTYCYLAMLNSDSSEEYIACYKKARKIYDLLGIKNEAQACQNSIDAHRILLARDGDEAKANDSLAEIGRENYKHQSKMSYGLDARALLNAHRVIEAERLAMKLATDSRRVHGPDHNSISIC